MIIKASRNSVRVKKHNRLRYKINGTSQKPRLTVFRSNKNIYAQLIDDTKGITICSASTSETEVKAKLEKTSNVEAAKLVGQLVGTRAVEKGIKEIVFDRSGYVYHGKVQALADAAREAGLQF